jgi:hypothetical protein
MPFMDGHYRSGFKTSGHAFNRYFSVGLFMFALTVFSTAPRGRVGPLRQGFPLFNGLLTNQLFSVKIIKK